MFTGLIETTGTVLSIAPTAGAMRLIIAAPKLAGRWTIGDSIAVNGVCLTALDVEEANDPHPGRFAADLATETVERTTLSLLEPGALVNLELPTPAGSPLGGHVVQGHVDATGTLVSLLPLHADSDTTDWRMTIEVPPSMTPYIVPQGSITIDGISLTVARVEGQRVEIAIIPHTYQATNLHSLLAGSEVNLEADVLSKYAERRVTGNAGAFELTTAYLVSNGY
jgi:riboflavin synthase